MITLILVRHGDAEPQSVDKQDKDRRLLKKGVKQMKRVANFIDKMNYNLDRIIVSPYVRAIQSAEVILDELGEEANRIEIFEELSPDKDQLIFAQKLKDFKDPSTILVVGHEPYLSKLIGTLTKAQVEIKRGGVAVVEYDVSKSKGDLKLLLTQDVLRLI